MKAFKIKMNEAGKITLPPAVSEKLALTAGVELIVKVTDSELRFTIVKDALKQLQQEVQALTKGASLLEELKYLRAEENRLE